MGFESYVHLSWSDLWSVISFSAASPKCQVSVHTPVLGLPCISLCGSAVHEVSKSLGQNSLREEFTQDVVK